MHNPLLRKIVIHNQSTYKYHCAKHCGMRVMLRLEIVFNNREHCNFANCHNDLNIEKV